MSGWGRTLDAMVEYTIHPLTQVVLTSCSQALDKTHRLKAVPLSTVERRDREGGAKPPLPAQL